MRTDVNAGFCKQVLKDIEAKKAPYWIEGELSDNAEKGDCSKLVCNWRETFQSAISGEDEEVQSCEESHVFKAAKSCADRDDCKTPSFMVKIEAKEF
eukprot:g580.t1